MLFLFKFSTEGGQIGKGEQSVAVIFRIGIKNEEYR